MIPPTPPRDTEPPIGSPISLSPSLSVRSSSPPPPDYPFDESIFAELDNSLWIIPRPLGSKPVPEKPNEMAPNRTSTSAAPAMTQATIRKLVVDSVAAALKAQAATMEHTDNTNRNTRQNGTPVARKCSYKEFMSCQPFNFKGPCTVKCQTCNKVGHQTRNSKNKGPATGSNLQLVSVTCHACGEKGHYRNQCPKANNSAHGRAYLLRDKNAHQDPNVVTDTTYDIEMADGNLVGTILLSRVAL
nr:hypothetical protein [Tanacetum cinerariifolium]